jgi:AraC-like DNA-binding protein
MLTANVRSSAFDGWAKWLQANSVSLDAFPILQNVSPVSRKPTATPLSEFVNFSEAIVRETRNEAIPWLVGLNTSISSMGEVGALIESSRTVGGALRHFVNYFELLQNFTDINLEVDERFVSLNYRILDPNIWPRHHDAMFSLGLAAQIIRAGIRDDWDCVEFLFEAKQSDMIGNISNVVNAPCRFGQDENTLRFPTTFLNARLQPSTSSASTSIANSSLARHRRQQTLSERIATQVFKDLGRYGLAQDDLASAVGMSGRSMRRKLSGEGTSYRQVLDECRMRQAVFEFRTMPELSITEIALRLGYAEHSTFTRAFVRWSGAAPNCFRRRLLNKVN